MVCMTFRPRPHRSATAGFTLIELMVIVALVGVLSVLAIAGYRYWLRSAKTGETKDLVQMIMLGQHTYYADTDGYLNCSSSFTDYYPIVKPNGPDDNKQLFHNPNHPDYECWQLLAPDATAATYALFTVIAGTAAEVPPQPPTAEPRQNWPPLNWNKPWYVVVATVDQDNDDVNGYFVGSAFAPNSIYSENESE